MAMNQLTVDDILRRALQEDIGFGDLTSEAIFAEGHYSRGYLLAKEDLVLAGMEVFTRVFVLLDDRIKVSSRYVDGDRVSEGEKFAALEGPTRALLMGERVALNFMQRLAGIATQTSRYVAAARGYGAIITDTRKTTPGLRMLEKYAVAVGGGSNHRFGLDSMVMIKDNHIKAAGGISAAINQIRERVSPFIKIEVETETLEQVREAVAAGVDVIMLDNMPIAVIKEAVDMIRGRALIEVSGNVTLERIGDLAAAGVDIISSGALTHSVKAADISMKLE
ncbi:carboxylating nicotinate-nucleotide diphosphorylase [Methylomusa anaerophila]|nr:carboxylating nicotinate-nucleotide diphosphorylase [Methylomusa anaerophila]